MLILSTFNSDYLQKPLQFLVDILNKSKDLIQTEYVESNLNIHLSSLKINKKPPEICIILIRLIDLIENNDRNVNIEQLDKKLDSILQNLKELKKEKNMTFIFFLCPSETNFLSKEFQKLEEKIKQELHKNKIHLISYEEIDKKFPGENFINNSGEENHIPYTLQFYCEMAILIIIKLYSLKPKPYKIIIVDCDNTLWDGLVGEVGWKNIELMRKYLDFQQFLIDQFNQGKLIVLASKNDKKNVMEVFHHREDMLLKEEHLVMELNEVNWNLKTNSIKKILKAANITPDHALFADDSEEERKAVEEDKELKGIDTIDMSKDAERLKTDLRLTINEYQEVTETDKNRTALLREQIATTFTTLSENKDLHTNEDEEYKEKIKKNIEEYHNCLEIKQVKTEDMEEVKRIAELTTKVNQFNINRDPKNEEEIIKFLSDEKNFALLGKTKQNLSNIKEIGSVALLATINKQDLSIKVLLGSCRVLARKMGDIIPLIKRSGELAFNESLSIVSLVYKKSDKNLKMCIFLNTLIKAELSTSSELIDFDTCDEIKIDFFSKKLKELDIIQLAYTDFSNETYLKLPELKKETIENTQATFRIRIELEKIIQSKNYLLDKFFSDDEFQKIKLLPSLESKIIALCNLSLGKEGSDSSLIARGLDSLEATKLRYRIFDCLGINIPIIKLLCRDTTVSNLIDYSECLKITTEKTAKNDNVYNQILPVSFQQRRIWLAEQQESSGNSSNYHMTACYKLGKNLNIQCFEKACYELIKLYDALGTTFIIHNYELKQKILPPNARKLYFKIKNLQKAADLEQAIKAETNVSWNMSSESLIRFTAFKEQTENNYYIFFHVHHAIFDASSLSNCLDMLSKIYSNLTGYSVSPISLPPQYIDFIHDQKNKLTDQVYQTKASNFWEDKFSRIENLTVLPTDQQQSSFKPITELSAKKYIFSLSFEQLSVLKNITQKMEITCFSMINGLFAFLIASYTYQEKVVTITATNGRDGHPSYGRIVGFFVNLLVQQFDLDKNQQLDEYLKNAHKNFLVSQEFQDFSQDISFVEINKFLPNPTFIYQIFSISQFKLNEEHSELVLPKQPIIFDLRETCRFSNFTLFAQEYQDKLHFVIEYAEDLYSPAFIEGFAENLLRIIKNASNNAQQSLQDLSVVCKEEQKLLKRLGQGPKLELLKKISIANKFQEILHKYPENIALSDCKQKLSYKEVDGQSTNLAHALIEAGVKPGNYVGIFLDENYLFFIAELAIIKIGAVFIPLSKDNPNERLLSIINDAKISFFIVDGSRLDLFDANPQDFELISIDSVDYAKSVNKKLPPLDKISDEFCVLYTSGSTGTPKGVILQEKGILRVVESSNFVKIHPGEKFAQSASLYFDAHLMEWLFALLHGAELVRFDKDTTLLNINAFRSKLRNERINHMWLTAGLFEFYVNNQPDIFSTQHLKTLMVGGDVVHKDTVLKVLNFTEAPTIINGYGPTETSIFALTHTFNKQTINNYNTTLIGSPINETEVEVVTPFGTLAPLGGIGELVIRGEGVAKGYLNSSLNENRFTGESANKSYHTGDLVKYTTKDLQIMFIGRKDSQQVKINGNLVALEEVRGSLSRHSDIKQVEVVVFEKQIAAFYTLKSADAKSITNEEFHKHLSKSLPFYMFPAFYRQVDDFIVNANGKLDKTQFRVFELEFKKKQFEEVLPKTSNGKLLLEIIQKILPNFPNNIKQNLFEFGCDSITSVYIINSINAYFEPEFIQQFKQEFLKIFKIESENKFEKFNNKFNDYLNFINFHNIEMTVQKKPTIEKLEKILEDKLNTKTNQKSLELFKKLKNKTQREAFELFNRLKHETESLRLLKDGDSSLPAIVFIHPAGGGVNCFNKLLEQVNFDNICYGIEDPLLNNNLLKLLSMEQMARNYLAIINNEIQGPFILVGYSFGGMLALEIAAEYELRLNEYKSGIEEFIPPSCGLLDTWAVAALPDLLKVELKNEVLMHCSEQRKKTNISENSEILNGLEILCEHHQEIGFSYKPRRLSSTPVFLFKATIFNEKFKEMHSYDENNFLLKFLDSKLFKSEKINATHYDMLENVKNNSLAELFSNKINEISNAYIKVKKIDLGGHSSFFAAPSEDMNDPKFHLHEPKIKK